MPIASREIIRDEWTEGQRPDSIVCKNLLDSEDNLGHNAYYGGVLVCESCPPQVADHIIALHNAHIEAHHSPQTERGQNADL